MSLKYIEFICLRNLLQMRRWVWNAYSFIILADNCGCGVICHCGMSRGHCCILETTMSRVFWQSTTPLTLICRRDKWSAKTLVEPLINEFSCYQNNKFYKIQTNLRRSAMQPGCLKLFLALLQLLRLSEWMTIIWICLQGQFQVYGEGNEKKLFNCDMLP